MKKGNEEYLKEKKEEKVLFLLFMSLVFSMLILCHVLFNLSGCKCFVKPQWSFIKSL